MNVHSGEHKPLPNTCGRDTGFNCFRSKHVSNNFICISMCSTCKVQFMHISTIQVVAGANTPSIHTRPSRIHLLICMQLHWHPLMRKFEDVWATVGSLCFQRCCQPSSLLFCSQGFKEAYVLEILRCFSAPVAQAGYFFNLFFLVVLPDIQDLHCWFTIPLRVTS